MNARETPALFDEAELVVVGAGPAGSSCAARAAERGIDVLLIDQSDFPRDKPCGDGVKRSGVDFLCHMGLETLVEKGNRIEGFRMVFDSGRVVDGCFDTHHSLPRCIPRRDLDSALVDAAIERGARFTKGRVDSPVFVDGNIRGVEMKTDSGRARVAGRSVIAADGATSRMRRMCAVSHPVHLSGYALRQYFTTAQELDLLFEVHVPLMLGGSVLAGYGWIFPIGPRLANIGLGVMHASGLPQAGSLRAVFEAFVDSLRARRSHCFGELQPIGKVSGSPVPLSFSTKRCTTAEAHFAGDAAHMVDPLTGEGIAYALRAGAVVADRAADRLRRSSAPSRVADVGLDLARRFPRLTQNPTVLARVLVRAHASGSRDRDAGAQRRDIEDTLAVALKPLIRRADARRPRITSFVERISPELADVLEEWTSELLDTVRTEFPFVSEIMHRRLAARSGPTLAATLLLANSSDDRNPTSTRKAALTSELIRLSHLSLAAIPIVDGTKSGRTHSALGVLASDLCLTRWMEVTVNADMLITRALIGANAQACIGQVHERREAFSHDRTPERYLAAVASRVGVLHECAASLGAQLAGASAQTVSAFRRYGRELGTSIQIADELISLLGDDRTDAAEPGDDLLSGMYTLPVIYAIQERPELKALLTPSLRREHLPSALAMIALTHGITRALNDCRKYADRASQALKSIDVPVPDGLEQLSFFAPAQVVHACAAEGRQLVG